MQGQKKNMVNTRVYAKVHKDIKSFGLLTFFSIQTICVNKSILLDDCFTMLETRYVQSPEGEHLKGGVGKI